MKKQVVRALFGILAAAIAASLQWVLWFWVGPSRFIVFYPAVIVASLLSGLCAGLTATFFSALAAVYLFFPPIFNFYIEELNGWAPVLLFITSGVSISVISETLKRRNLALAVAEVQRKGDKRFRQIFDSSPYALLAIVDAKGTILLTNPRVEAVFGYAQSELIGQNIDVLVPDRFRAGHSDHRKGYMEHPTPRQLGVGRDLTGRRKDGSEVPVEISLTPIETDEGQVILATVTDISVRKLLEVDLLKALHNANEAVQLRDQFISIASHELRTPLTAFGMQIQLLGRLTEQGTLANLPKEKAVALLKSSKQQLEHFSTLINDLLDVTRIRAGRLTLNVEKNVDLSGLTRDAVTKLQMELTKSGSSVDMRAGVPVIGTWDPMRMEQVLINLLSNAMKYGAGKPIEVTVQIEGETAKLMVRDHGVGIAPIDQARIFERFERAVSPKSFGGLGLGLYIVRKIIEEHHGSIHVESELGQGATFIVELPLAPTSTVQKTT